MTPPSRRAYGPTVRAIRESRNLGSVAVADQAGLSKGYYANFEAGRRRPTAEPTAAIAHVLGVDVETLTGQRPAIATIRDALGIDAATLARDVGVSTRQLERFERGTEIPDDDLLIRIARLLGVDPEAFRAHEAAGKAGAPARSA